VFKYTGVLISP